MITVQEYHALPHLSSSKLKHYVNDRWKFKKLFLDGIAIPDKKSNSKTIGELSDFFLLRDIEKGTGKERFDDLFTLYSGKVPGGQMGEVTEALYNLTIECKDEEGTVTKSFEELLEGAYNEVAFDKEQNHVKLKVYKTYESFVKAFTREGLEYYEYLRKHPNSTVVTMKHIETAEHVFKKGMNHPITRGIFSTERSNVLEIINQFPFLFEYEGLDFKILLDKIMVDQKRKLIAAFDLKVSWDQDAFYDNFIYLKYYIQAGLYWLGMTKYRDENYPDYKVLPFEFVVVPSTFTQSPLRFRFQENDLDKLLNSFTFEGKKYRGLNLIIEDIKWHLETGDWSISKTNFLNKGIININISNG